MSSYYPSFNYMGINSLKDKNLIVVHFDADNGEHDTFLGMDSIYSDKYDGSCRFDYGAKFNSVALIKITVVKSCIEDFTVAEVRDFLRWTTGVRKTSFLDLMIGDNVECSFLGRVINAYQHKIDARTVGMSIEFESVSPWAYSPLQSFKCSLNQDLEIQNGILYNANNSSYFNISNDGIMYSNPLLDIMDNGTVYVDNSVVLSIDNKTDDLYSYIGLNTTFANNTSDYISIHNITTDEETIIKNMSNNEIITLDANQFISSDIPNKVFGNDFNFIWPRLAPGVNNIVISGSGEGVINFSYKYPIKIGDCAIDLLEVITNSNCNCGNNGSSGTTDTSSCYVNENDLRIMLEEVLI